MSIVMHPLTALNGSPAYTADDYRHTVNPFMFPSNGSAFNCIQGVRYGSPLPLATIDGVTVTVKPHCGVVSPWENVGAYTYAITEPVTVMVSDSSASYKVAVVVEDPSQSHGETPNGSVKVYPGTVPDKDIPGLVISSVHDGVVDDIVLRFMPDGSVLVPSFDYLAYVPALDGMEASTRDTNYRYRLIGGVWQCLSEVVLNPGQWTKDWALWYKCSMSGNIVSLMIKATRGVEWKAKAWEKSQIATFPDYVRPKVTDFNVSAAGAEYSGFQLDKTGLYVRPFRDITYAKGVWTSATMSWSV
nr:MAG: hypothetical protein [Bacteriophage sp.]